MGSVFPLQEGDFSVGRDSANRLTLADPAASRRHCLFRRGGGSIKILDLGSSNGTFVNGVPVREHVLEHGDEIRIGSSQFQFVIEQSEAAPAADSMLAERAVVMGPTVRLHREDALYLDPERLRKALPTETRIARDLSAILKISTTINSIHDPEKLQRLLLDLIFEVVGAERGAILLSNELGEFMSVSGRRPGAAGGGQFQVSRTIVDQVLREGDAILSNDVLENGGSRASQSLTSQRIASLMAVPLVVFGRRIGLIYLDAINLKTRFEENDLQLVTAIAAIAAVAIESARRVQSLENDKQKLVADLGVEHRMIGESSPIREILRLIARVASTESTVLIRGESGTGKELVARAIHQNSSRSGKPFVAINCAALPEALLESELFGYERGAFTGASARKRGKLEVADAGTVFLDEIGEIPPPLQTKLLRVLQEREFDRVGGTQPVKVDIRVIAATNRNLEEAVQNGTFRQDLFYRLNVIRLMVPSLRERREDIPLLASYFAARQSEKCGRRVLGISPETRACLLAYDWPGNVRELENAIERAIVLGVTDQIMPEDLPEEVLETSGPQGGSRLRYYEAVQEAKRQIVLKAVDEAEGSHNRAAEALGIHPNNLHRLMKNLGLKGAAKK